MRSLLRLLFHLLHFLLWGGGILLALLFILLCIAAYGIPGRWINPTLASLLPADELTLTVERVAYLPVKGLQVKGLLLRDGEKKRLLSFSSGSFGFTLFSAEPWEKRLTRITLDDLFVAQIEYDPDAPVELAPPPPELRRPFPDLSGITLPEIGPVALRLRRPDVLEIQLQELTGTLSATAGELLFSNLRGQVDSRDQICEADLEVDLHEGVVRAHIRGFIFQTRLNGIWHALNFPVIEKYSNNFTLNTPAWGDCAFVVGFDKYRNIFTLSIDIVAKDGAYCGVPFDEASATISCRGIWDTVTSITPLVVRRKGDIVARGELIFDTVADRFRFQAESSGLQPDECLRLIDMPFTEVIPPLVGTEPPRLTIRGHIPLYAEQTPERVFLDASLNFPAGGTLYGIPVKSASTRLAMQSGTLTLSDFSATLPNDGTLRGSASFQIPPDAAYTDLTTLLYFEDADLSALLTPVDAATPENATLTGFLDLRGRTDETFARSLNSNYSLTVDGGLITRLPLFAGLTDLIADNIPGISALTDSSTAKMIGTAEKGFFTIPEFSLTGDLLSIEGPVSYDLNTDLLLARITAGNFKHGSLLGTLTRWVTVPLNKLIWEVKVTGPLANPDWKIITIVDGIWQRAWGNNPFAAPESGTSEE